MHASLSVVRQMIVMVCTEHLLLSCKFNYSSKTFEADYIY